MSEKREIIVVVRGSEECICMIDGETLCDYDQGDGYDDGAYLTECPHGSVVRALAAADVPPDVAAEALGLRLLPCRACEGSGIGGSHTETESGIELDHQGYPVQVPVPVEVPDPCEICLGTGWQIDRINTEAARRVREAQEKRGATDDR